jgi:hypothetical protein
MPLLPGCGNIVQRIADMQRIKNNPKKIKRIIVVVSIALSF